MDKETETQLHFLTSSGERQSDRLVADCLVGLASFLHGHYVQVDGKRYKMKVLTHDEKVMFDIEGLPGFDHIEFVITKTGWGRGV